MTRNPWSGLAPAVDAHLARWAVIRRVVPLTTVNMDGRNEAELENEARRNVMTVAATDAGRRWLDFARSYGLPDDQGRPQPSIMLVDRERQTLGDDAFLDQVASGGVKHVEEGATISGREQFHHTGGSLATGMIMIQRELLMLDEAVTHYVSAEVVEEVTWAAEEAFPEPLFDTDLITPSGFAVLETPLQVVDLHVDTGMPDPRVHVQVRAIGWQRHGNIRSPKTGDVGEGVTLFLYTTPRDYIDGYVQELRATGHRDDDTWWAQPDEVDGPFLPLEVIPWRFGAEWEVRPDDTVAHIPGTVPSPVAYQRRWFFAFMRLCWQEIIVRHADHEPRQVHRRWERLAQRKALLDYTTLRLRRVVDPFYQPSGMGLPLDHRVRVRAHWRRQWVPSLGPARLPDGTMDPATHRLVWIEAHWRGPEDGPIGPLHSATVVTR